MSLDHRAFIDELNTYIIGTIRTILRGVRVAVPRQYVFTFAGTPTAALQSEPHAFEIYDHNMVGVRLDVLTAPSTTATYDANVEVYNAGTDTYAAPASLFVVLPTIAAGAKRGGLTAEIKREYRTLHPEDRITIVCTTPGGEADVKASLLTEAWVPLRVR